jgi:hypothetical protein
MNNTRTLCLALGLGIAAAAAGEPQGAPPGFTVDREKKEILIPCRIAPRKLPNLPEIYPIEVCATYPAPQGQKAHETVVSLGAKPTEVHKALESLGLKAGKPVRGEGTATGAELEVLLEIPEKGKPGKRRVRLETLLIDKRTGKPLPPIKWLFTGSSMKQPDPAKPDLVYAADLSGTLVGLLPVTDELVIQSSLTAQEEALIKLETAKDLLPPEGTEATLILRPASGATTPAAAGGPTSRSAAEAEVQNLGNRMSLPAARPAPVVLPPPASSSAADPFQHRRDLPPCRTSAEEACPLALPLPPPPVEAAPPGK